MAPNGKTIPKFISKKYFPNFLRLTDINVIMHLNSQCNSHAGYEISMESAIFCYVAPCYLVEFTDFSEERR
jgi:hypothetical protein